MSTVNFSTAGNAALLMGNQTVAKKTAASSALRQFVSLNLGLVGGGTLVAAAWGACSQSRVALQAAAVTSSATIGVIAFVHGMKECVTGGSRLRGVAEIGLGLLGVASAVHHANVLYRQLVANASSSSSSENEVNDEQNNSDEEVESDPQGGEEKPVEADDSEPSDFRQKEYEEGEGFQETSHSAAYGFDADGRPFIVRDVGDKTPTCLVYDSEGEVKGVTQGPHCLSVSEDGDVEGEDPNPISATEEGGTQGNAWTDPAILLGNGLNLYGKGTTVASAAQASSTNETISDDPDVVNFNTDQKQL